MGAKTDLRIILMTGSHPRHLFLAHKLADADLLSGLVIEEREDLVPSPPDGLLEIDRNNFIRHFKDRDSTERRFFDELTPLSLQSRLPGLTVRKEDLNGEQVKRFIKEQRANQIITYGVHKIDAELLNAFPAYSWNIHGGLSPWYRGVITLFWPFYFLRPNWAGMTIHFLSAKLDAGAIVHHSLPNLKKGDGIHDVACRAVEQVTADLVRILRMRQQGQEFKGAEQRSAGKLFISSDWQPQHLRVIYNLYNNDLVDRYLEGQIPSPQPPVTKAF